MVVTQLVHTLKLDHQGVFDKNVGKVISYRVALVVYFESGLGFGSNAPQGQFPQKRPFINLLQKSST